MPSGLWDNLNAIFVMGWIQVTIHRPELDWTCIIFSRVSGTITNAHVLSWVNCWRRRGWGNNTKISRMYETRGKEY